MFIALAVIYGHAHRDLGIREQPVKEARSRPAKAGILLAVIPAKAGIQWFI